MPCWAELVTSDPSAVAEFYRDLLGWRYDPADQVFRLRGAAVAGLVPSRGQPAGWVTYIACDDLAELTGLVADSGGEVLRPPEDLPGRGRYALLADASGAVFGAWQSGRFGGSQLGSEPGTVCFSELATPDVAAGTTFYGKVFGWAAQVGELAPGHPYHDWLIGDRVLGGMYELPAGVSAHWRTTVEVADLERVLRRCRDRYGRVEVDPIEVTVGRYARIVDPYGAGLGVIELIPELSALTS